MIKRIYMQWSLRSKYLQKISAENPYKIGSWLSSPYDKGTEGASHCSQLIARKGFLVKFLRSVATTSLLKMRWIIFSQIISRDFGEDSDKAHVR